MKNFLYLGLLLLGTSMLTGQNDIQFGFQLSPTFSWMSTDDNKINGNGTNLGLQLGMIGEYYFRENYSITSGIGFHFNAGGQLLYEDIQGVRIWNGAEVPGVTDTSFYAGGTNFKYSVQYVEIPIGLKLRTREFGYLRYYVEPRLSLGLRTQARGNITGSTVSGTVFDGEEDYRIQDGVNFFNLSWGIGGGVEYALSTNTSLIGGLAFQNTFTDISRDRDTQIIRSNADPNANPQQEDSKATINSIVIRLGIMF